jgi:hypothetical protein
MQRRILLLPLIWAAYGIGEVLVLSFLFGPVINNIPFGSDDKPIGGSYLPVLFFNFAALLGMIGLSLYALGIVNIDLSNRKTRNEFIAVGVLAASGVGLFYIPVLFFVSVVTLVYLLAVMID